MKWKPFAIVRLCRKGFNVTTDIKEVSFLLLDKIEVS